MVVKSRGLESPTSKLPNSGQVPYYLISKRGMINSSMCWEDEMWSWEGSAQDMPGMEKNAHFIIIVLGVDRAWRRVFCNHLNEKATAYKFIYFLL